MGGVAKDEGDLIYQESLGPVSACDRCWTYFTLTAFCLVDGPIKICGGKNSSEEPEGQGLEFSCVTSDRTITLSVPVFSGVKPEMR